MFPFEWYQCRECTWNDTQRCLHWTTSPLDSCLHGEKWFKLVMFLTRIDKQKESKVSAAYAETSKAKDIPAAFARARAQVQAFRGSYEPFDYIALPRHYKSYRYDEMVLVEVKTGDSRVTKWQREILNYAKGSGIKVLILRVDGQAPDIFCKLANQLVSVEEF